MRISMRDCANQVGLRVYVQGLVLITSAEGGGRPAHCGWRHSLGWCKSGDVELNASQWAWMHSFLSALSCGCDASSCFKILPLLLPCCNWELWAAFPRVFYHSDRTARGHGDSSRTFALRCFQPLAAVGSVAVAPAFNSILWSWFPALWETSA